MVSKNEYEVLANFRYELRKFLRFSEREAKKKGLAAQQYLALLAIEGFPGKRRVSIGELAERLQIAPHSTVGLVDRLESAKLVARVYSIEDRRRVYVQLTTKGRQQLEALTAAHRHELQTAGPLLTKLLKRVVYPKASTG